jgi:ABC-2 type transport system permease protein
MKKALLVARWEFLTTVTRKAYIFAVVAMPLFYGGMFALAGFAGRSASTSASRVPTGLVDNAHIVDLAFASEQAAKRDQPAASRPSDVLFGRPDQFAAAAQTLRAGALVGYSDLDMALKALGAQQVAQVFVVEEDYLTTGAITVYARERNMLAQPVDRQRQTQVADAIRASLLKTSMSGDRLTRAFAPTTSISRMKVDQQGHAQEDRDSTGFGPFAGPFSVFLLLTMAVFFSAGFLQQATVADRQNRMIEILLSSIDPTELLVGKVIGLGGAGLLQVAIYVVLVIVPGAALLSIFQLALGKLALSIVYFVIGYLLFACLMAGTGMIGRTAQEAAQLSVLWTLTAAAPMFFFVNLLTAPNGLLARVLSFFPLTSPVTMMLRLTVTDPPWLDVIVSMAIDTAAIYLAMRAAAKLFRAAALMYGKRATLPELVRWLRAA